MMRWDENLMSQDLLLIIIILQDILRMATGIFDQKMFRPANQMYYFQLVPKLLTIRNQSLVKETQSTNAQFRLKILKGVQVCDEMKKSIGVRAVNGKAGFDKAQLNFNLPSFNINRNIQFTLILLRSQEGSEEQEVGRYTIISNHYVIEFKNNKTRHYQEQVNFGDNYSLRFDLFTDSSRFGLQKLIKQTNEEKKEQKRQNILVELKKTDSANDPTLNQARSQVLSDSQKVQVITSEGRFMSPTRRIVRKQSDSRKILKRQSSPTRSQDETSSKKGLKFLSRNTPRQETTASKTQSLAEEEAKKLTEIIRVEEQKRQKIIKQKEVEDIQRKIIEDKKRRQQQLAKKAEENRINEEKKAEIQRKKDLEAKRIEQAKAKEQKERKQQQLEAQRAAAALERQKQVQRKKELEARRIEEARVREQKRLEAERRQQQLEGQKAAELEKQVQAQRKKQEQTAKKVQEARQLAQQQRLEAQKRREEEKAKRIQQQKIQNSKRITEQQQMQKKLQAEEQNRRVQLEQLKKRQQAGAQQTKQAKNIKNNRKQAIKKQDGIKVNKKTSRVNSQEEDPNSMSPAAQQQKKDLRGSILVRVKTEQSQQLQKFVFDAKPIVDSQKWKRPVDIKKTASQLFDKQGKPVKEVKTQTKAKNIEDTGPRNKILLVIFIIISLFLVYAAFPQKKTKRRR